MKRQLKLCEIFSTDDHELVSKRSKSSVDAADEFDDASNPAVGVKPKSEVIGRTD